MNKNILFICSQNKLRSPTAEQVYSKRNDLNVLSAGLNNDAEEKVSGELLEWADTIFVMEKAHINRLKKTLVSISTLRKLFVLRFPISMNTWSLL